jgi:hypothetical protein
MPGIAPGMLLKNGSEKSKMATSGKIFTPL